MNSSAHHLLVLAWFCLIGLMLAFYVVTDGFDLGVGILSLFRRAESDRDVMLQSIGHVWDANETWLVVLSGALFGAFPTAYAMVLQDLYIPIMALIASLIMRGAAIEFRHAATRKRAWDVIFGVGSLLAAICQGIVLGKVITGLAPGVLPGIFVVVTAIGVASGYALLGSTWLIRKTHGGLEQAARRSAIFTVFTTVAAAAVLSAGTMIFSSIGHGRWAQPGVFHVLCGFAFIAVLSFVYIVYAVVMGGERGPFRASVLLFLVSFAGLAISLFPDIIPGRLSVADAASDSPTLVFMLFGIGTVFPVMIGYNLFQYYTFRGKVVAGSHD